MINLSDLLEPAVVIEFRRAIEGGGESQATDTKSAALLSIAVSLKRIADSLGKQETTKHQNTFHEEYPGSTAAIEQFEKRIGQRQPP